MSERFFYGWAIVVAATLVSAFSWGTLYAFGVFFKPIIAEFSWSRAATSGTFSLNMIIYGLSSILMGGLSDRYGPRRIVSWGGILIGLGAFLSSRINVVWQLYLFYGLIMGMGMGASYVPLMGVISRWFLKRRGLAIGIVMAGVGLGTLMMSPLAQFLISRFGWRNAYQIIGVLDCLIILAAAGIMVGDPRQKGKLPYGQILSNMQAGSEDPVKKEKIDVEMSLSFQQAKKTGSFWVLLAVNFLWYLNLYMVLVHMVPYATDKGIPSVEAAGSLALLGACSIVGKITMGRVSDRIGGKATIAISFILQALGTFLLISVKSLFTIYAFAALFGFAYGGVTPQQAKITGEIFGTASIGSILGVIVFSGSIGGSFGPFLGGFIFDGTGSYGLAFALAAMALIIAFGLTFILRKPRDVLGT
jgi:OFA family oxalate/formate antiporter-like MFS transporter